MGQLLARVMLANGHLKLYVQICYCVSEVHQVLLITTVGTVLIQMQNIDFRP